jgi:hypothetical protein
MFRPTWGGINPRRRLNGLHEASRTSIANDSAMSSACITLQLQLNSDGPPSDGADEPITAVNLGGRLRIALGPEPEPPTAREQQVRLGRKPLALRGRAADPARDVWWVMPV